MAEGIADRTSKLGRTGIVVPTAGFGGIPIGRDHLSDKEGADIVRRVIDSGVKLIDTFSHYGRSEIRIGMALEGRRDDLILVTKSRSRFGETDFAQMIEQSLKNLNVDYIDFLLLKNVDNEDCVANIERLIDVLNRLREQGKIRFTGLSSHSPTHSMAAIETGLIDAAEVPYNYANTHFEPVLDRAAELGVGILAMKPLGGGRLFSEAEKGHPDTLKTLVDALSFSMSHSSQPVLIPGLGSEAELDRYLEAIPLLKDLDPGQKNDLAASAADLGADFCRACGYCVTVCPAGIPIDEILPLLDRVQHVQTDDTFKKILKGQFEDLDISDSACEECRKCIEECPYKIAVPERLKEAFQVFAKV